MRETFGILLCAAKLKERHRGRRTSVIQKKKHPNCYFCLSTCDLGLRIENIVRPCFSCRARMRSNTSDIQSTRRRARRSNKTVVVPQFMRTIRVLPFSTALTSPAAAVAFVPFFPAANVPFRQDRVPLRAIVVPFTRAAVVLPARLIKVQFAPTAGTVPLRVPLAARTVVITRFDGGERVSTNQGLLFGRARAKVMRERRTRRRECFMVDG